MALGAAAGVAVVLAAPESSLAAIDTFVVDTTSDAAPAPGDCSTAPGDCSLRQAIAKSNDGDPPQTGSDPFPVDQIVFESGLSGEITLGGTELPTIEEDLAITGPGPDLLTISGAESSRIFHVDLAATSGNSDPVEISGLTIANGVASGTGADANGGGVYNRDGDLTITNAVIRDNTADELGGGIYFASADPQGGTDNNVYLSTVTGNAALAGGGIYSHNFDRVERSTISGNYALADYGGGMYVGCGTVLSSTVTDNYAAYGEAGISRDSSYCAVTLVNSVVADNFTGDAADDDIGGGFLFYLMSSSVENPGFADMEEIPGYPNLLGVDPQLGPLQPNGGPTPTQKPAGTSPLVDQGSAPAGEGTDQRGFPRLTDLAVVPNAYDGADIGAVELTTEEGPVPSASPTPSPPQAPAAHKKKCKKRKNHKHHKRRHCGKAKKPLK